MISFPPLGEEDGTEGPMIIEAEMGGHFVHRMYVDRGSSLEILYEHCFNRFRQEVQSQMVPATTPLVGFSGEIIWPLGHISLFVKIGTQHPVINQVTEERIKVAIHPEYPKQTIAIGSTLTEEGRKELCGRLRRNLDVFAWKPADMTGVSRHIAEHRLNIREGCIPFRQKKKGQAPERNKAIHEEVEKLVNVGFEQSMPQRWISATGNRLEVRVSLRIFFQMFPGRIQRVASNKDGKRRRGKYNIHHKLRDILLLKKAVRIKEYQSNLSTSGG
ncbi:hypothetical protein Tco_0717911 [Tanacetum coccineum]